MPLDPKIYSLDPHQKPNSLKIDVLYAFISVDAQGNEGICAFTHPETGMYMPMVGADMKRVELIRPLAVGLTEMTGVDIQLVKFEQRTLLEVLSKGKQA